MRLSRVLTGVSPEARSISFQDIWSKGLDLDGFGQRHAGVKVDANSAMALSAVFGAWRIISEGVATLPHDTMIRRQGIPAPYRPRPDWVQRPNATDTWIEFVGQVMVSQLMDGNAYVLVNWNGDGSVGSLKVLDPGLVEPERNGGMVVFKVRADDEEMVFPSVSGTAPFEILHFRAMSAPGSLVGLSPIEACAETFGISLAAQKYGSKFFANDATPGGVIELPPEYNLSEAGQRALKEQWHELYGGPQNAKRVAVLTQGAKFAKMQIAPAEAQFLETRAFQIADVARIYGVPPHLLGDASGSTSWGSGLAEQNTAYVIHTLRPYLERVESRFTRLLQVEAANLTGRDVPVYLNLNEEALLRGDTETRWASHRANVATGVLTADEVRREEGYVPLPDGVGAVPWIPLAQAPTDDIEDEPVDEPVSEGGSDEQ